MSKKSTKKTKTEKADVKQTTTKKTAASKAAAAKKTTKKTTTKKTAVKKSTASKAAVKKKTDSAAKTRTKSSSANDTQDKTTKSLMFYSKPVPLNTERHRTLRLRQTPPRVFDFVKETNAIPIAGHEFFDVCRYYPIVFTGSGDGMIASALMGLRDDENLMVDATGYWEDGYVPAFVRRYPFVLGEKPDSEDYTVLIDEDYAGFTQDADDPALFDEDGGETEILTRAKAFLGRYQAQVTRTQAFIERLQTFDLLVDRVIHGTTSVGENYALHGFRIVDETRLHALTDARLQQLFANDELAWLYAHLISLRNVRDLAQRLDRYLQMDAGNSEHEETGKSAG